MLSWKNNTPRFSLNGDFGDALLLYFGETNVDDIIVSECILQIRLLELNDTWSAKAKLYRTYNDTKEPEVDIFISELTSALQAHLDFDFSKYWSDWTKVDPHFRAYVLDSSKHTWLE